MRNWVHASWHHRWADPYQAWWCHPDLSLFAYLISQKWYNISRKWKDTTSLRKEAFQEVRPFPGAAIGACGCLCGGGVCSNQQHADTFCSQAPWCLHAKRCLAYSGACWQPTKGSPDAQPPAICAEKYTSPAGPQGSLTNKNTHSK